VPIHLGPGNACKRKDPGSRDIAKKKEEKSEIIDQVEEGIRILYPFHALPGEKRIQKKWKIKKHGALLRTNSFRESQKKSRRSRRSCS